MLLRNLYSVFHHLIFESKILCNHLNTISYISNERIFISSTKYVSATTKPTHFRERALTEIGFGIVRGMWIFNINQVHGVCSVEISTKVFVCIIAFTLWTQNATKIRILVVQIIVFKCYIISNLQSRVCLINANTVNMCTFDWPLFCSNIMTC